MPHEYKSGETVDGLQEGPVVHGISSGACGTVRHLAINASGVVESYLSSATTSNVYISNATIEQTTGDAHNNKNIAVGGIDTAGNVQPLRVIYPLVPEQHDQLSLVYSGTLLAQVVYLNSATTMATLTLNYSSGALTSVVKTP